MASVSTLIRTLMLSASFCIGSTKEVTPFADKMFGVWLPKTGVTQQTILGPASYKFLSKGFGGFSALRHQKTGDVWLTLLDGQLWHVVGNEVQYCFGIGELFEQSPFSMDSVFDNNVTMCWRRGLRGMPTHTPGCSGCDCAKITLALEDDDTLHFWFWMSQPVVHANLVFTRSAPEPAFNKAIERRMLFPYKQCALRDHYGPNLPGEPDLHNKTLSNRKGGCAASMALSAMKDTDFQIPMQQVNAEEGADGQKGKCHQLNGVNFLWDSGKYLKEGTKTNVSDVRFQYIVPPRRCDPCDVSYSVSAKVEEDEYIAVGFKGQSWEHMFPYPPEISRPCYFGMCVDAYDNFTSDRIALGYTSPSGGCFREMVAKDVVGSPTDVDTKILTNTAIERSGGRTVLRFTVNQHFPHNGLHWPDGPFRVMWAIGKVNGARTCDSTLGYHGAERGVAPLHWLPAIEGLPAVSTTPCDFNTDEMGVSSNNVIYT